MDYFFNLKRHKKPLKTWQLYHSGSIQTQGTTFQLYQIQVEKPNHALQELKEPKVLRTQCRNAPLSPVKCGDSTWPHLQCVTSQIVNINYMSQKATPKTMQARCTTCRSKLPSHQNATLRHGTYHFRDYQVQSACSNQYFWVSPEVHQ